MPISSGLLSLRSLARLRARLAAWPCALVLLVVLAMLCGQGAQAQTTVSGSVSAPARWTLSGSPYLVQGEVSIQGGALLTIDAGVTVSMGAGAKLTVLSGGIQAIGTSTNPVRVLSDKTRQGGTAAPGDWEHWAFTSGTTGTRLEHVQFEHGKGLVVSGSAPIFNYLDIRHQLGAAIAIDLAASPTGVGNQASGNTLNGIAVPAGDVTGSVQWGLRGMPYVVSSGTVSVGASPLLSGVSPTTLEQGQTLTLTLNGARLDGLLRVWSDQGGLSFTPFSGGSATQAFVQISAATNAPAGPANLRVQVDAGELLLPNAVTITPPLPSITNLDPAAVLAGAGLSAITVNGRNFTSSAEVLFNAAAVPTTFVSATQLRATLPNQTAIGALSTQVRAPDAAKPGQHLLSNSVALQVQAPVPPIVSVEPTPIALPPDSKARDITIRLSKADYRDNTLSFSISDTSKATVSPASLTIPAGQTSATVSIVPKAAGTVSLAIESANLQRISVPLFIAIDTDGINTAYAQPVGIVLQGGTSYPVTVAQTNVGVVVGSALTQVSPRAWPMGANPSITIQGIAIPSGAQVSVMPSTGISVGTPVVNVEASTLSVVLATAADAPAGPRKLVVRDASGKELFFVDPAQAVVQVMSGVPLVESIEPLFGVRGTTLKLLVRGRNLQQGQIRILPDTGLYLGAAPATNAEGTQMTTDIEVAGDAPLGDRVLQVVTPGGASAATLTDQNTFKVVSGVSGAITPIVSPLVGVTVGQTCSGLAFNEAFGSLDSYETLRGIRSIFNVNAGVLSIASQASHVRSDIRRSISAISRAREFTIDFSVDGSQLDDAGGIEMLAGSTSRLGFIPKRETAMDSLRRPHLFIDGVDYPMGSSALADGVSYRLRVTWDPGTQALNAEIRLLGSGVVVANVSATVTSFLQGADSLQFFADGAPTIPTSYSSLSICQANATEVAFNEPFTSLDPYTTLSGNRELFSVDAGALNIASQYTSVVAAIRRSIGPISNASEFAVDFSINGSQPDDTGSMNVMLGNTGVLGFNPKREGAMDGLRRPHLYINGVDYPMGSALSEGTAYRLSVTWNAGTQALNAEIRLVSSGVLVANLSTTATSFMQGADGLQFSADSGGSTIPATYRNLSITKSVPQ